MSFERMRLRSSVTQEERQEERKKQEREKPENRPFIRYSGVTKYYTTFIDCAVVCDKLLNVANSSTEPLVLGFDLEWPFTFQTGPGKTSLIQISPNLEVCYLFHVSQLKTLPKALIELLAHCNIRITGVNIKNDIRKLCRDFSGFNAEKIIQNCIDSGVLANTILPFSQRWSMEKLVGYLLKMRINKDKAVRMSKWHLIPLTEPQQIYAATDAYASLLLYFELKKRERDLLDKEQDKNSLNL